MRKSEKSRGKMRYRVVSAKASIRTTSYRDLHHASFAAQSIARSSGAATGVADMRTKKIVRKFTPSGKRKRRLYSDN